MEKNAEEKNLISYEEKGIFSGIISFFKNLLFRKSNVVIATEIPSIHNDNHVENDFKCSIKVIDEELNKLKQDVENEKIAITDLTEEQIDKLQEVYNKQIENDKIRLSELQRQLKHLKAKS